MKETKSHFTVDIRGINGEERWFLIDIDESLKIKTKHTACVSMFGATVQYKKDDINLRYLCGRDDLLPRPTISDYMKASTILKNNNLVYNKKKGTIEDRKSLRH